MYYLILMIIILIVFSIMAPKSKLVFFLNILGHTVILGGYNGIYDLSMYELRYNREFVMPGTIEKLYDYFAIVFHKLGFSFQAYHILLTFLCVAIIAVTIDKMVKNSGLVLGMMFGYSMLEYALQLQSMVCATVIIVALYYFYKKIYIGKPKIFDYLIYILLIVLGMGFHFAAVFFLGFLIIKIFSKKTLKKVCIIGPIILLIFLNVILVNLSKYILVLNDYIGNLRSTVLFICMIIWQIAGVIILHWNHRILNAKRKNEEDISLSNFIIDGSYVMLFCIPFFSLTTIAERIMRIWIIFYYCTVAMLFGRKYKVNISVISMFIYNLVTFLVFYVFFGESNGLNIFSEIFKNNYFIGG